MLRILFLLMCVVNVIQTSGQTTNEDSLKNEILRMKADVRMIELNLAKSEKKFKQGILVATIGYTTVIAGGLMLGREQDELGKGLLIAGGIAGVTGTVIMLDAFKYLGRPYKQRKGHTSGSY